MVNPTCCLLNREKRSRRVALAAYPTCPPLLNITSYLVDKKSVAAGMKKNKTVRVQETEREEHLIKEAFSDASTCLGSKELSGRVMSVRNPLDSSKRLIVFA